MANKEILHSFFLQVPEAFQKLMDDVERTMKHTIEVEENIPMETVTNFDEVIGCIVRETTVH